MIWADNPDVLIDGDISKTLTNCATDANAGVREEYGDILVSILRNQPLEDILNHIHDIMSTLLMISEDEVLSVRLHLVTRIISIFREIRKHASADLEYYLYDRILQIIFQYLQDEDYLIKGETYSAFITLLKRNVIDKKMIVDKICPAILNFTKHYEDESQAGRTSAGIVLMGRIAPIIGSEVIEETFLDNYLEMCSCSTISVRSPCATIFPIMCQVLGTKITEEKLLDTFFMMCDSSSWGTRNICAESIALISVVCSPECRRDRLTPIVLKLTRDPNKCVVSATLKVLGQFISTFATPTVTGLAYTQNGELYIVNPLDTEYHNQCDPKILKNCNNYLNTLAKAAVAALSTSSSEIRRNNNDELSCEEIAKMIQDNISKINKQISEDVLKNKDNILKISKEINEDMLIKKRKQDDINCDSFRELPMGYDENEGSNLTASTPLTYTSNNSDVFSTTTSIEDDSLSNYLALEDATTNEIPTTVTSITEAIKVNNEDSTTIQGDLLSTTTLSSTLPKKKGRHSMAPTEHFWRKNTPTDLSSIIKRAINEGSNQQQHDKRKLVLPAPIQCPPTAPSFEIETPTSEQPPLKYSYYSNDFLLRSKSIERLNEYDDDNSVSDSTTAKTSDDDAFTDYNSHKYWYISPDLVLDNDLINEPETFDFDDMNTRTRFDPPTNFDQDIIPVDVLECFVKMVLYDEDEDMNLTCAYNFPAVAFTIGKQNWHIIKTLLQYLCDDLDWKVRKTIASSMNLLALVLGTELATQDLLPIFLGFFKDLDQVKIKAIGNFAKFLKTIDPLRHEEVLSNIGVCLRIDSKTNWRIKEDLAQQIVIIIKMYDSINKYDDLLYLTSVTGIFLEDKINCVREIAADAMTEIIRICSPKQRDAIIKHYLVKEFSLSYSWRKRQTFVHIFHKYIKANKNASELVRMMLQDIRRLSYDSVPNIRMLVAKSLVQLFNKDSSILTSGDSENVDITKIIRRLQEDDDRDVKEIAHLVDLEGKKEDFTPTTEISESITLTPAESTTPKSNESVVDETLYFFGSNISSHCAE